MARRYGKVDRNHAEIAEAFRKLGCSFLSLAPLGKGAPDAAIGYAGLTILVEIKAEKNGLTDDQEKFWNTWKGGVRLVRDMEGVAETVKLLQDWHRKICSGL